MEYAHSKLICAEIITHKKTICATDNSQYQQSIQIDINLLKNRAITKQNNKKQSFLIDILLIVYCLLNLRSIIKQNGVKAPNT